MEKREREAARLAETLKATPIIADEKKQDESDIVTIILSDSTESLSTKM